MSVHFWIKYVYGVPCRRKEVKKSVTKYNEDTGEAYQKTTEESRLFTAEEEIEIACSLEEDNERDGWEETYIHYADYGMDDGWILGVVIEELMAYDESKPYILCDPPSQELTDRVHELLEEFKITETPNCYVLPYVSC